MRHGPVEGRVRRIRKRQISTGLSPDVENHTVVIRVRGLHQVSERKACAIGRRVNGVTWRIPYTELFAWMWQCCHLEFISNSFGCNAECVGLLSDKDVPGCGS
jgi:hypothetical protein